ncbi:MULTISPECIES: hypothetical protein [unclassified Campylobacter]|uniref:hypothetical protein n=1 Tax=unclassified Campylobacter TaxID=2593542 RepID=UPI0022E9F173|nr:MULTISPECIES: hypothetical protein [unclassified Campylobacter]MDA3080107.1 hypothetical protein [Campylobacter sp. CS_NA2]MDA3081672.1 hypothetical protein [Campylobacter sp. CS_NA1]MDA3086164.1 hypothetical protein [Campylobacter sp. CS_ED1]MDA3090887.1 hypothetical protein [Campylobacter sp. CS_ED2]WBR51157.1 hypothetical protein PF026_07410 [Campylobacter sp. CS_NA3]
MTIINHKLSQNINPKICVSKFSVKFANSKSILLFEFATIEACRVWGLLRGKGALRQNKRSDDAHKVRGRFLAKRSEAEQVSPFPP